MSALGRRIGDRLAAGLMHKLRQEEAQDRYGLRDTDQPSEALTEITRHLGRSEFTPEERARIRQALDIRPLEDIGGVPGGLAESHISEAVDHD